MLISAIVAVASNQVIGADNQIPWYLPADLKYFKKVTLGHHIIMGRKNFESIGRALPGRTNVVITRNPFYIATNCVVVHSLEEALQFAADNNETEAFVIGGGDIYRQSMPLLDRLYLTRVACNPEGDVFFPEIAPEEWTLLSEDAQQPDERNPFPYTFQVFQRKA